MPILLSVPELRPGMRLAQPLLDATQLLLPADKELERADIQGLVRRVPHLSALIVDPILDELASFADEAGDQAVARQAQSALIDTLIDVRGRFEQHMSLSSLDVGSLQRTIQEVIAFVNRSPVAAAMLVANGAKGHYLTTHPANVFYLSLVIGNAVRRVVIREWTRQQRRKSGAANDEMSIAPLALGALFLDVAMWPMEHLYGKSAPLTAKERAAIRRHPVDGANMLPDGVPDLTRLIVRTHHENIDGSGYPDGLVGDEIHLFARIVRVADAFDAAIATPVFREAKSPVRVLWEMSLGPHRRCYDKIILKVFSQLVHPYPIGAKVRLSNGQFGVVVRHGIDDPFRPQVIIAFDGGGKRLPRNRISGVVQLDLQDELRIVSFRGEDLSYVNQTTPDEPDATVLTQFESLFESAYP